MAQEGCAMSNLYGTICEAPSCYAALSYSGPDFNAAIENARSLGWLMQERDEHGYLSLCPAHKEGRTETMQRCSTCGNICPTCDTAYTRAVGAEVFYNREDSPSGWYWRPIAIIHGPFATEAEAFADSRSSPEWSGSECETSPGNCWIDDVTGEHVDALTCFRTVAHPRREVQS